MKTMISVTTAGHASNCGRCRGYSHSTRRWQNERIARVEFWHDMNRWRWQLRHGAACRKKQDRQCNYRNPWCHGDVLPEILALESWVVSDEQPQKCVRRDA